MILSAYDFSIDASGLIYTFLSKGFNTLTKKVIFTAINPSLYNVELRTEKENILLPDTENSNNGDVFNVLWTCTEIIRHFMDAHPASIVYIRGSEDKRQRKYQRMLADAMKKDDSLKVFGERYDGEIEPFQTNTEYIGCLVFRQ